MKNLKNNTLATFPKIKITKTPGKTTKQIGGNVQEESSSLMSLFSWFAENVPDDDFNSAEDVAKEFQQLSSEQQQQFVASIQQQMGNMQYGGMSINASPTKKYQEGGRDKMSMLGYSDDSPYKDYKMLPIDSNYLTMDNTGIPLMGVGNQSGEMQYMNPYSGDYYFPNDESVTEYPLAQTGTIAKDALGRTYSKKENDLYRLNNTNQDYFYNEKSKKFIPYKKEAVDKVNLFLRQSEKEWGKDHYNKDPRILGYLMDKYGNPDLVLHKWKTEDKPFHQKIIETQNYFNDNIYGYDSETIMNELPHKIQDDLGYLPASRIIKDNLKFGNKYKNNTYEKEAHSLIEPKLRAEYSNLAKGTPSKGDIIEELELPYFFNPENVNKEQQYQIANQIKKEKKDNKNKEWYKRDLNSFLPTKKVKVLKQTGGESKKFNKGQLSVPEYQLYSSAVAEAERLGLENINSPQDLQRIVNSAKSSGWDITDTLMDKIKRLNITPEIKNTEEDDDGFVTQPLGQISQEMSNYIDTQKPKYDIKIKPKETTPLFIVENNQKLTNPAESITKKITEQDKPGISFNGLQDILVNKGIKEARQANSLEELQTLALQNKDKRFSSELLNQLNPEVSNYRDFYETKGWNGLGKTSFNQQAPTEFTEFDEEYISYTKLPDVNQIPTKTSIPRVDGSGYLQSNIGDKIKNIQENIEAKDPKIFERDKNGKIIESDWDKIIDLKRNSPFEYLPMLQNYTNALYQDPQYRATANIKGASTPELDVRGAIQSIDNELKDSMRNVNMNNTQGAAIAAQLQANASKNKLNVINDAAQKNAQIRGQNTQMEANRQNQQNQMQQQYDAQYYDNILRSRSTSQQEKNRALNALLSRKEQKDAFETNLAVATMPYNNFKYKPGEGVFRNNKVEFYAKEIEAKKAEEEEKKAKKQMGGWGNKFKFKNI